jgi:RNA polymerase sigma-70 factor (ECF subfamily)
VDNNAHHTIANASLGDNDIIARVLQGERNLFALLVQRYNQRLYRVGMSIVNDDTAVEDIMQSAYIKAWEHLAGFRFDATFATWITRILINESLRYVKQRKQSLLVGSSNISNAASESYTINVVTPHNIMLNQELKKVLEEAIRQLPEKYRVVFVMREMEHMSIAETKECLDLTEVNVKVRLSRAKALLRDTLNSYYKKEDILHFHLARCSSMAERVMAIIELRE